MSKGILFSTRQNIWRIVTVFAQVRLNVCLGLVGFLLFAVSVVATNAAPTVTVTSPTRNVLAPGQNVNLSVTATGSGTVTYQWLRKGKAIAGATSATLAISGATSDSGWYLVDATDGTGTTRSKAIFVIVCPAVTQVWAWGSDNSYGQQNVPLDLSDAVAVATGSSLSLALTRGGSVRTWGDAISFASVPSGLTDVVAIAGVYFSGVALKSDGTVVVWGLDGDNLNTHAVPSGLTDVVDIAAGYGHILALKSNGSVVAWGLNTDGQATVPVFLEDVTAVSAGNYHSLALKGDGTVVAWGRNGSYGTVSVPPSLNSVTAVAAGGSHSIALKSDGTLVTWGLLVSGEPNVPKNITSVVAIAGGAEGGYALQSDGRISQWNFNEIAVTVPSAHFPASAVASSCNSGWALAMRDATNDASPTIATQPVNRTVVETQDALLSVSAVGTSPLSYQWRKNGVAIVGATTVTLVLPSTILGDAGTYDVVITNYLGSITSLPAVVTVSSAPAFTDADPLYKLIHPGQSTTLATAYSGPGALSYQWHHNNRPITGATGSNLSLANVNYQDSGSYVRNVTDANGVQRSAPIFVTVAPAVTQIRGWGLTGDIPVGPSDIIAITEHSGYALALRNNGAIAPLIALPYPMVAGLSGIVSISVGFRHSLALRRDGTVVAWGDNYYHQSEVPVGLSNVVAVKAGDSHSLALKSDGTVVAWGSTAWGQCNVPVDLTNVVAIVAGSYHSAAIKADGTIVAWGDSGQPSRYSNLAGVSAIESAGYHTAILKQDGTVVVVGGDNSYGQLTPPGGLTNVRAIGAGAFHSMALKDDGTVVCWGNNSSGRSTPPENLGNVFSIAAGLDGSYAVRDATNDLVPTIVAQPLGQTKIETGKVNFFVSVTGPGPYSYQWRKGGANIAGATASSLKLVDLALADAGNYDVVTANYIGSTTSATATLTVNAIPVVTSLSPTRQVVASGQSVALNVTATGTGTLAYQWTHDGLPIAGATSATLSLTNFTRQDAGYYLVNITDNIGTRISNPMFVIAGLGVGPVVTQIRGWGSNDFALISPPSDLNDAVAIAANSLNVLALRKNGTVVSWGTYAYPVPVGLSNLVAIATGSNHALALKGDGTVVAWGSNSVGQSNVPAGLVDVVAIACGYNHSLALKKDGTVIGWGENQLSSGAPIPGLQNVVGIAGKAGESFALKSNGTIVGWGYAAVGYFDTLPDFSNLSTLTGGLNHLLLLQCDGTVIGWGYNAEGQISIPNGLLDVVAIGAGRSHSLALKSDGTVSAWGLNTSGQATVPEGLPNVIALTGGEDFSLALRDASADAEPSLSTLAARIVVEDQSATWNVIATGAGPFDYQWRKNGVDIVGATSKTLALNHVLPTDAGSYDVVVTNYKGPTTSNAAALTVLPLPVVTAISPARQVFEPGQNLSLSVAATGTGSLNFQWLHNGRALTGATSSSFSATNLSLIEGGWYVVDMTDDNGTRRSQPMFVIIAPAVTKLHGWGLDHNHLISRKPDLTDMIAVSTNGGYAHAIQRDGSVVSWGDNYGTPAPAAPIGLTDVVAVCAGGTQPFALKSDGTVVAWGNLPPGYSGVSPSLNNVVAITAQGPFSYALKGDGTVVAWGESIYGMANIPAGLNDVTALAAGYGFTLALKSNGTVVGWGAGGGQVPSDLTDIVAIDADQYGMALKKDGTVVIWASFAGGRVDAPPYVRVPVAIAATEGSALMLSNDGPIEAAATNNYFEMSTRPTSVRNIYSAVGKNSVILALSGESAPMITLQPLSQTQKEQQKVMLSVGATGITPLTFQWRKSGTNIPGANAANLVFEEVTLSDAGSYDVVIINSLGSATSKAATVEVVPVPVITGMSPKRNVITPGDALTMSLTATGTGTLNYQWFHNRTPVAAATSPAYSIASASRTDSGWYQVEITDGNGTRRSPVFFVQVAPRLTQLVTWGAFASGSTLPPADLNDAVMLAAGYSHYLVLKRTGTVLGLGVAENPGVELSVLAGLTDVVAIAESDHGFSLALKSDGSVVAWGKNESGQTNVPLGLKDVVAISAGGWHAMALKSNGTVVCWGQNTYGQSATPRALTDVVGIAAGKTQSLAIKRDGTMVSWGDDMFYYVGPSNLSDVIAASAAGSNWVTLRENGTVSTWGYWGYTDPPTLNPPTGLSQVIAVSAAAYHSLALKSDGTVVAWGYNDGGSAFPPADLDYVMAIAAGSSFSLALTYIAPPSEATIMIAVE